MTARCTCPPPTALRENVRSVAFDERTYTFTRRGGTLKNWQLESLHRNASEWLELQRLDIDTRVNVLAISVCDSRVLLGA